MITSEFRYRSLNKGKHSFPNSFLSKKGMAPKYKSRLASVPLTGVLLWEGGGALLWRDNLDKVFPLFAEKRLRAKCLVKKRGSAVLLLPPATGALTDTWLTTIGARSSANP